jgi:putative phosphoesterase
VKRVGVISDSHVPHRMAALPPAMLERLSGCDLILHAGDLDDPRILEPLAAIAPVKAVRGNWHLLAPWPNDQQLPLFHDFELEGQRILLTHGHLSVWNSFWEKRLLLFPNHHEQFNRSMMRRLPEAFPGADVYVFGHSHKPLIERHAGALFLNPGAVCPTLGVRSSLALLTVTPDRVTAQIVWLEER